jgi:oligopeptide/dipeptide ABC transporter ATP-binding protein
MILAVEDAPAIVATSATTPVLSVRDLTVSFPHPSGVCVTVVDGVGFDVMPGEIVGLVGESGSGKSVTARAVLRLLPAAAVTSGEVLVAGEDVGAMSERQLQAMRGATVSMIFQDPMTSFDPVHRVGTQIAEAIAVHRPTRKRALARRVGALLAQVGIAPARARAYPHELSGGMRQRAMTAMAVANGPALMIADEPTTALDVTVQDQVMQLMRELNENSGTAILLITHNIAVVASLCTRLVVLYAGRVVEDGPTEALLQSPQHPYTWALLQSVPRLDRPIERLLAIAGHPPDPAAPPGGCRFHPRCLRATAQCTEREPPLEPLAAGHRARCWHPMDAA